MRLPLLVLLFLAGPAALAGPPASAAMNDGASLTVPILAASYGSPRIDVVAGDTVTWRNDSARPHSVAAADGSWASERLPANTSFSHRFDTAGVVDYYCRLHPFMQGEVGVHRLLLTAPRDSAAPGRPFVLVGRGALPAGSTVSIEADGAAPHESAATATVDASGTFRATVKPRTTTSFRAVAGDQASPPVLVLVLDRRVEASARTRGRRVAMSVRVLPASPGATVVLQLHLRNRFGWWPVRTVKLDRYSRARFVLPLHRKVSARVALTLGDGATVLARSRTLRVGPASL